MNRFAFISEDSPTTEHVRLAAAKGVKLVHVGDRDAFTVTHKEFFPWGERSRKNYDGVVVVHAAAALRLIPGGGFVGVFENSYRDGQCVPIALHVYDVSGCDEDGIRVVEGQFDEYGIFRETEDDQT